MSSFSNPAAGAAQAAESYRNALLDLLGGRDPLDLLPLITSEIRQRLFGTVDAELRTPEAAGKWSIIEVVQHLADTELVFGFRLRMVLAQDQPRLAGMDQDLWCRRLRYVAVDLDDALEQLAVLRRGNLRLIEKADATDLKRVGMHEERGPESIELLLKMMAGHDLVHLRQIDRIRRAIESHHDRH